MIQYVVLILGTCFMAAPTPTTCSGFTNAFSTTKFCTGVFVGMTPFVLAQMFKKTAHHASSHYPIICFVGNVGSACICETIGAMSRTKNSYDKDTKKLGESFLGGFVSGFLGVPLTLWLVNTLN